MSATSSIGSDHSSRSSEAKLFGIEFSDLHVSKEDSVQPRCDQLDSQLFEAEDFADEDSVLVPTDVAAPMVQAASVLKLTQRLGVKPQ
jgi:hypothetical protein